MSNEDLQKSLDRLRSEVDGLDDGNAAKERLNALVADVEHQVENADDAAHRASVLDRLPKTIEHMETEHPRLTSILNEIMVGLSNIGI